MTLLNCSLLEHQSNRYLLLISDSMLSGGYRWKYGPKIFPIYRRMDCAVAFEGDTQFAYPLLLNALNFIQHSDYLSDPSQTDVGSVCMRLRNDIAHSYTSLQKDKYFTEKSAGCSFLFVGWARTGEPVVWRIHQPKESHEWSIEHVERDAAWLASQTVYFGNGDHDPVSAAWANFKADSNTDVLRGYRAFRSVLMDSKETGVGGSPQVVLLGRNRLQVVGVQHDDGKRSVLGHSIATGAEDFRYVREDLNDLFETIRS